MQRTNRCEPREHASSLDTDDQWIAELGYWRRALKARLSAIVVLDENCSTIFHLHQGYAGDRLLPQPASPSFDALVARAGRGRDISSLCLVDHAPQHTDAWAMLCRLHGIERLSLAPLFEADRSRAYWIVGHAHRDSSISQQRTMWDVSTGWSVAIEAARYHNKCNAALLTGAMDAVGIPCFVGDIFGETLAVGERADALMRRHETSGMDCRTSLGRIALDCYRSDARSRPSAFTLHESSDIKLVLTQLKASPQACWLDRLSFGLLQQATAHDPLPDAALNQLTQAEQAVTRELVKGRRLSEVADLRKVSIETVRSQAKTIYSKLGVRNHIDLLALVQRQHAPSAPRPCALHSGHHHAGYAARSAMK